ncbi:hypothetical protein [Kitasatospora sp. NPDC093679]|uniref:hypothetical protein n=1 Tax=Kitasatospora sp. NPDC093679 TaxID=3154983 RepID=UPI003435E0E4
MDTITEPLPYRNATAAVTFPASLDQRAQATAQTTVAVFYRVPLQVVFRHVLDGASRWSHEADWVTPHSTGYRTKQQATARLLPLVDVLLNRPELQPRLQELHAEALRLQAAHTWRRLSRARGQVAEAAREARAVEAEFRAFEVPEAEAAALIAAEDAEFRRWFGFPAPRRGAR